MSLNMRFLICDAETMSVNEDGLILDFSFIAVDFNKRLDHTADELEEIGVKWKFDAMEQKNFGRHIDLDTKKWWSEQPKAVRKRCVLPSEHDISVYSLIDRVEEYCEEHGFTNKAQPNTNFWLASRGELEAKLLHNLYQQRGQFVQRDGFYDFWRWRDIRTMIHFLAGAERGYIDVRDEAQGLDKHDSLHDCIIDALQIQKALKGLVDE